MNNMDEYAGRVQAVVWSAEAYVSRGGIRRVQHLVEHGEPAEGMLSLAWIIVNEGAHVPWDLVQAIRELAAGLVEENQFPAELDTHVLTERSAHEDF